MRLTLSLALLILIGTNVYSQLADTIYVTKDAYTTWEKEFGTYFVINYDSKNHNLFHVSQYYKSQHLKRQFVLYSKDKILLKNTFLDLIYNTDFQRVGKEISYSELGKAESESFYAENGQIEFGRLYLKNGDTVYIYTQEMPLFPGGDAALLKFINNNCIYPKEASELSVSGNTIIRFIIDDNGQVTDPTVIKSLNSIFDQEALRVIKMIPRMCPGKLNGRPVKVFMSVPVYFKK